MKIVSDLNMVTHRNVSFSVFQHIGRKMDSSIVGGVRMYTLVLF